VLFSILYKTVLLPFFSNYFWSPEGRRRARPEMKWEREVERGMKQKNVTPEDAVNR
jgi:hypothetical protein